MTAASLVVAVPARDEAVRLPRLLESLARQTTTDFTVVVALNNTSDCSLEAVESSCARHPHLRVIIDTSTFAPIDAHAGSARRRAMDVAADLAGPAGLILTTDADTRPPPDWIVRNRAAMAGGVDIVGGQIVVDEEEPMSAAVAAMRRHADNYWARVREIEDMIDPVPWDPPPRHGDHTGASLCLSVSAYRRCGGLPVIPLGEDRALVQAVVRHGGRLAHPIAIWTRVSPRIDGRAKGGMADHMKKLRDDTLAGTSILLPSFLQWRERAEWRRGIRRTRGAALIAELEDQLPPMLNDTTLDGIAEPAR